MSLPRRLVLFAPAALLAAGCGKMRQLNPTAGRVTAIDANQGNLRKVSGSSYEAYFQQSDLHLIEEQAGSDGAVRNRYYFREGKLFHVRQTQGGRTQAFFLTDQEVPLRSDQTFSESEARALTARARALRQDALAKAPPTIVLPLLRNR